MTYSPSISASPRPIKLTKTPTLVNGTKGININGKHSTSPTNDLDFCPTSPTKLTFVQKQTLALSSSPPTDFSILQNSHRQPHAFILGTRSSKLALVQTKIIQASLRGLFPDDLPSGFGGEDGFDLKPTFTVVSMKTAGDQNKVMPLYLFGGSGDKALWTKELEAALFQGQVDLVVHSLKDVPTTMPPGCELAAITERVDPRDALVVKKGLDYKTLGHLPNGAVVGTSSVRRVAQLRAAYPHLKFSSVRGNIDTRLSKLDDPASPFAAIILAAAGMIRIGISDRITSFISPPIMYHSVGQGALGIEVRTPGSSPLDPFGRPREKPEGWDERTMRIRDMVKRLNHWPTAWRCAAEREMLHVLEGGCSVPVGVETEVVPLDEVLEMDEFETDVGGAGPERKSMLKMSAIVTSLDGAKCAKWELEEMVESEDQARLVGRKVAKTLLNKGGREILQELGKKVLEEDDAISFLRA